MTTPPTPRAHARYAVRLSVELRTPTRRFAATTRDLSVGGCCVEGPYPVEEGAAIDLAMFVVVDDIEEASLPPLECQAIVQWCGDNDEADLGVRHVAGLRFVDLGEPQLAWLARFLTPAR